MSALDPRSLTSEHYARYILQSSLAMIVTTDLERRIVEFNRAAEDAFGYTRAEVLGRHVSCLYADELAGEGVHKRTLASGDLLTEIRNRRKNGEVFPSLLSASVLRDDTGRVIGIIGTSLDITARKRAEEALAVSETRYRRLFESAQDGILIIDAGTGQIVEVNPALIELLGYSEQELLGKKLREIAAFKGVEASDLALLELPSKGLVRHGDLPLETNDGRRIAVELISNVYLVDDKNVIQCNLRDITARKNAEAKIRELNAELEQRVHERTLQLEALTKELATFNYSVAHDLRTPLRHIAGFAAMLRKDYALKLEATGLHLIDNIVNATQRMSALIEALLTLASLSRKKLEQRSVDLSALAHLIASDLQQSEPGRRAQFVIAEDVTCVGDDRMLRIVLENLLGNAWKFTAQRDAARIEFGVAPRADGSVAYFVRDNGAGFDMQHADKLFGPFQRLHSDKEFPGTGIGLATVQRIIHRHDGRVWAEAGVDKGATFYFTLG